MVGLNKVMIIGNVGTDPEMRYTANGNAVTTFRIACSRNYTTPDGERKEETEWFNVVTWSKLAETFTNLASGAGPQAQGLDEGRFRELISEKLTAILGESDKGEKGVKLLKKVIDLEAVIRTLQGQFEKRIADLDEKIKDIGDAKEVKNDIGSIKKDLKTVTSRIEDFDKHIQEHQISGKK